MMTMGNYGSLKLVIKPWFCAPGTHYDWKARVSMELKSLPDMSTHEQEWESNPRPLILSPTLYPLSHMLP